jgi:hypothetical protein
VPRRSFLDHIDAESSSRLRLSWRASNSCPPRSTCCSTEPTSASWSCTSPARTRCASIEPHHGTVTSRCGGGDALASIRFPVAAAWTRLPRGVGRSDTRSRCTRRLGAGVLRLGGSCCSVCSGRPIRCGRCRLPLCQSVSATGRWTDALTPRCGAAEQTVAGGSWPLDDCARQGAPHPKIGADLPGDGQVIE